MIATALAASKGYYRFADSGPGRMFFGAAGMGSALFLSRYQDTYGWGAAMGIGALMAHPLASIPVTSFLAAQYVGRQGTKNYRRQRHLNMFKDQIDRYGTVNQMRQASIQKLSRNRVNPSRMLGNESFHFHR